MLKGALPRNFPYTGGHQWRTQHLAYSKEMLVYFLRKRLLPVRMGRGLSVEQRTKATGGPHLSPTKALLKSIERQVYATRLFNVGLSVWKYKVSFAFKILLCSGVCQK